MPTGSPDFNQQLTASPTSNQGETPNRILYGFGSNSQSGRWLWAVNFENGLEGILTTGALYVSLETDFVYQGMTSCKIITAAAINNNQGIYKYLFSQGKRYGLECMIWNNLTVGADREIIFVIEGAYKTSGRRAQGIVIWKITAPGVGTLQIDVSGTRTTIATVNDYSKENDGYFHYFKLSFDPYENRFIRLYFDDLVFDLAGTAGYNFVNTDKNLTFAILVKTKTAAEAEVRIDNLILTADEP